MQKRLAELEQEARIMPLSPVVQGGFIVIPRGIIERMSTPGLAPSPGTERSSSPQTPHPIDTQTNASRARDIVMDVERHFGYEPVDREFDKLGYDIESRDPVSGRLRFIEVKGRVSGAESITVTRNEILYSIHNPENYIFAIVEFLGNDTHRVHYLCRPFNKEPEFGVVSVNYSFKGLLAMAEEPY